MTDLSRMRLNESEKKSGSIPLSRYMILLAVVAVVVIVIGAVVLFSGGKENAGTTAAGKQPVNENAGIVPATPGGGSDLVTAGGYIEARQTAALLPQRNSQVKKVYVKLGDLVQKGDRILEFESAEQRADVEYAKSQLRAAIARLKLIRAGTRREELEEIDAKVAAAQAEYDDAARVRSEAEKLGKFVSNNEVETARAQEKAALARLEALKKQQERLHNGYLPQEIEAAEAEVELYKAAVDKAQAVLNETVFLAPFTGRIVRLDVEEGEALSPIVASTLEIADTTELWVRIDVPENKIAGLDLGDRAEVFVEALDNEKFTAYVVEIAPLADRRSNTIEVAVALENPDPLLRPNMSARVTIFKESTNGN